MSETPRANYDADLQMYIEPEKSLDEERLQFLRWMVTTGRLLGDTRPRIEEGTSCTK